MSSSEQGRPANTGLKIPGLVNQLSPVEQVPFPESDTRPFPTTLRFDSSGRPVTTTPSPEFAPTTQPLYEQDTTPHLTRVLPTNDSPRVTRLLADLRTQTGALSQAGTTTSFRQPVVIRGSERKPVVALPASRRHKLVIKGAIFAAMAILMLDRENG